MSFTLIWLICSFHDEPLYVVELTRFELVTSFLSEMRSDQLNYSSITKIAPDKSCCTFIRCNYNFQLIRTCKTNNLKT